MPRALLRFRRPVDGGDADSGAADAGSGGRSAAAPPHDRNGARRRPDAAAPTASPSVGLGDLVRRPGAAARARTTDGPKLQSRRRVCLPRTLEELGWAAGTDLFVRARGGAAVLAREGAGRSVTVNVGNRLYLPVGVIRVLGAEKGDVLFAHVPTDEDVIVLYGPATTEVVDQLLHAPEHRRRLASDLDVDVGGAAALASLATRLDGRQLAALAAVSTERFVELGVLSDREVG